MQNVINVWGGCISHLDCSSWIRRIELDLQTINARLFSRDRFIYCEWHRLGENGFPFQFLKMLDGVVASRIRTTQGHGPM